LRRRLCFLWVSTVLASDAPVGVVTAFWLVVGGGITLWVRRDLRADAGRAGGTIRGLESALRRDAADVFDVRARSFAEFEEIEDEGACYAFELDGGRLVFIAGQEFYAGAKFPSLDFSLVYVLDERGGSVDMLIDKRGAKAVPARTIPSVVKRELDVPGHLETRIGRIDDVEDGLRRASDR
jgi:hypothetical protein